MADPNYGKTNFIPGFRLIDGAALNRALNRVFQGGLSREDSITATAGGTKAAARILTKSNNHITVCATGGDSVLLPKAIAGSRVTIRNDGAASCNLFGKGADTINGVATATATALANGKAMELICYTVGAWFTLSVQA